MCLRGRLHKYAILWKHTHIYVDAFTQSRRFLGNRTDQNSTFAKTLLKNTDLFETAGLPRFVRTPKTKLFWKRWCHRSKPCLLSYNFKAFEVTTTHWNDPAKQRNRHCYQRPACCLLIDLYYNKLQRIVNNNTLCSSIDHGLCSEWTSCYPFYFLLRW